MEKGITKKFSMIIDPANTESKTMIIVGIGALVDVMRKIGLIPKIYRVTTSRGDHFIIVEVV